jgi:hypothetical protein
MRAVIYAYDTDHWPPKIDTPPVRLDDPLGDLQTWIGASTERSYIADFLPGGQYAWSFAPSDLAVTRLQHRRSQANGRPLWTVNLIPEPLRNREWSMFVCHATDTDLIPADNLDELRRKLARPGDNTHKVTAAGKAMTLFELESWAHKLRTLGATDATTVSAQIGWRGGLRTVTATFTPRDDDL